MRAGKEIGKEVERDHYCQPNSFEPYTRLTRIPTQYETPADFPFWEVITPVASSSASTCVEHSAGRTLSFKAVNGSGLENCKNSENQIGRSKSYRNWGIYQWWTTHKSKKTRHYDDEKLDEELKITSGLVRIRGQESLMSESTYEAISSDESTLYDEQYYLEKKGYRPSSTLISCIEFNRVEETQNQKAECGDDFEEIEDYESTLSYETGDETLRFHGVSRRPSMHLFRNKVASFHDSIKGSFISKWHGEEREAKREMESNTRPGTTESGSNFGSNLGYRVSLQNLFPDYRLQREQEQLLLGHNYSNKSVTSNRTPSEDDEEEGEEGRFSTRSLKRIFHGAHLDALRCSRSRYGDLDLTTKKAEDPDMSRSARPGSVDARRKHGGEKQEGGENIRECNHITTSDPKSDPPVTNPIATSHHNEPAQSGIFKQGSMHTQSQNKSLDLWLHSNLVSS